MVAISLLMWCFRMIPLDNMGGLKSWGVGLWVEGAKQSGNYCQWLFNISIIPLEEEGLHMLKEKEMLLEKERSSSLLIVLDWISRLQMGRDDWTFSSMITLKIEEDKNQREKYSKEATFSF